MENMEDIIVVTGKSKYVKDRVAHLRARGYSVITRHVHPNGDITVKLERV
jgi:hypothetical protein